MKFTKKTLEDLTPRKSKYFVFDDAVEKFGLVIQPSGKKAFVIRLRFNGKQVLQKVADFPATTISYARQLALPVIEQYQAGINVKEVKAAKQVRDRTLRACIEEYIPTVKPRTQVDVRSCMNAGMSWTQWLDKPLKDITEAMVLKAYDKRAKVAKNRARVEMAYLRAIWNSNKRELNLPDTPTAILNEERKGWNNTNRKHGRLDFETAPAWYKALDKISKRDRAMFLLIYYTGLRVGEAMRVKWSEIDFDNRSLHLKDTKNGSDLDIPLSTQAIAILKAVPNDNSGWVFSQISRSGVISAMKHHTRSNGKLKEQGVKWSCHNCRRGFIVSGGVLGLNSYMIKQLVGHSDSTDVHASYQRYTVAEMRSTAQKICDHLEKQLHATDNVIDMSKAKDA